MNNLIDIQTQIEKLQKQASEIKSKEFDKTVLEILAKMQAFGITLKDLQPGRRRKTVGKVSDKSKSVKKQAQGVKKTAVSSVAAKYRGPEGETWSGRGLTPRWLAALLAQGKTKEEFAVKS
ncbi:MAG: H-NS histone family protein [Polaromonas sp.]|nr:H-NS histone family protein [Polaromonas sp.]MDP3751426.1 H-NS histone family protein [Polaromonas sp.]MDZ4263193.1 H-NS histone family protein [Pseudomonadota bacterium]